MRRLFGKRKIRLRLSQSLGAFPRPGGDISPLFVFFEIANEGGEPVEITRLRVVPKDEERAVAEGEIKGKEKIPFNLAPGEDVRFQVRAKTLARALKDTGYVGTPKVSFAVVGGDGNEHSKTFKFRVDEYLELKDE